MPEQILRLEHSLTRVTYTPPTAIPNDGDPDQSTLPKGYSKTQKNLDPRSMNIESPIEISLEAQVNTVVDTVSALNLADPYHPVSVNVSDIPGIQMVKKGSVSADELGIQENGNVPYPAADIRRCTFSRDRYSTDAVARLFATSTQHGNLFYIIPVEDGPLFNNPIRVQVLEEIAADDGNQ